MRHDKEYLSALGDTGPKNVLRKHRPSIRQRGQILLQERSPHYAPVGADKELRGSVFVVGLRIFKDMVIGSIEKPIIHRHVLVDVDKRLIGGKVWAGILLCLGMVVKELSHRLRPVRNNLRVSRSTGQKNAVETTSRALGGVSTVLTSTGTLKRSLLQENPAVAVALAGISTRIIRFLETIPRSFQSVVDAIQLSTPVQERKARSPHLAKKPHYAVAAVAARSNGNVSGAEPLTQKVMARLKSLVLYGLVLPHYAVAVVEKLQITRVESDTPSTKKDTTHAGISITLAGVSSGWSPQWL